MKPIMPIFREDRDKLIAVSVVLLSLFFFFIPSMLVILFGKNYIDENSYNISKATFNFELFIFLVSLVCIIPIIGWLIGLILVPILYIWNVIVIVLALCAIAKGSEVKIPTPFEFV